LPLPDGPITERKAHCSMEKETSFNALTSTSAVF